MAYPMKMSVAEEKLVTDTMQLFGQLQTQRNTFAQQWEEVAQLVYPSYRNTFFYGSFNWQGEKKTERQIDATGMMALQRFGAICDSLLTPRNMMWHGLEARDEAVRKDRQVRLWFEQVTRMLFRYRYMPIANFSSQNQTNFQSLGAFGNAAMFVDTFDATNYGPTRGIRYRSLPLGELFFHENHQGLVDGCIRWFRLTPRQAYQLWGQSGKFPDDLRVKMEQNSEVQHDFLHRIYARSDYDAERLDDRGKPWASCYISLTGNYVLQEGGYRTFPIPVSRYTQGPGEVYGRGPAMQVLPALKTLNAEKGVFLKQGHRAADPSLLIADDGILDVNFRPGGITRGGISSDGKMLVGTIPTGQIQVTEIMMDEERKLINDAFLVSLFQIMTESPQMTATEVIERVNEKGILIAPTVSRQQDEYLGPMIDRELDVLANQGLLPPMPGLLREANGEYQVQYTSPLSKAMRAQEVSGFLRTIQSVQELVSITQDASLLDVFDFDVAIPEIAETQSVPVSWMASEGQISSRRKARAAQQAAQQQIQAAPAAAAIMKAKAVQAKSGMGPQQPGAQPGA